MRPRKEILEQIFSFEKPEELEALRVELREYGWDSDKEEANLTKNHIAKVLERYIEGKLTEQQVEDWANAVELREDIEFGNHDGDVTVNAIHILANPILEGELTWEYALDILKKLEA